jgi:hypothetical protein
MEIERLPCQKLQDDMSEFTGKLVEWRQAGSNCNHIEQLEMRKVHREAIPNLRLKGTISRVHLL